MGDRTKINQQVENRRMRSHGGGNRRRSPLVLLFLLLVWSILLGWGISLAVQPPQPISANSQSQIAEVQNSQLKTQDAIGTVDPVTKRHQLGQELYLANCSSCHIALSPAVLPTSSWQKLLEELNQHYGKQLPPIVSFDLIAIWEYLKAYSRPLIANEKTPYRVSASRYFKALHPRVELPRPTTMNSCITCHPGATKYNFRQLTPEWENSP
jgi:mono/diheme cytochrome c family protein